MRYPTEAPKGLPPAGVPFSDEIRAASKERILEMLRAGDLDEMQAEELISELGLRSA